MYILCMYVYILHIYIYAYLYTVYIYILKYLKMRSKLYFLREETKTAEMLLRGQIHQVAAAKLKDGRSLSYPISNHGLQIATLM
jgi:hypothetical protein